VSAFTRMARRHGEDFVYTGFTEAVNSKMVLPGTAANNSSTDDDLAFDVLVGDLDLRIKLQMADFSRAGVFQYLIHKAAGTPATTGFYLRMESSGLLRMVVAEGAVQHSITSTVEVPAALNGTIIWLRAAIDLDDGAGNHVVVFYTSVDDQRTWVVVDTVTTAGVIGAVNDVAEKLRVGTDYVGANFTTADVYRVQVRNGIGGALVYDAHYAAQAVGATSFADLASALTVTINAPATIAASAITSHDEYGDVTYTADATPDTIRGIRLDSKDRNVLDETGEERSVDIEVLVPAPLKNSAGVALTLSDVTSDRAPTLTDASGRLYQVVGIGHEAATPVGAQRILCARQVD